MARFLDRIAMDNVVRIAENKDIITYLGSIVMRMQPGIYNKYSCIKLRYTIDLENKIKSLCQMVWHCGLVPIKKIKLKDGIQLNRKILISDAREIWLGKIGAIQAEKDQDDDFTKWWDETEYAEEK